MQSIYNKFSFNKTRSVRLRSASPRNWEWMLKKVVDNVMW